MSTSNSRLAFVCRADADLYRALEASGESFPRSESLPDAIAGAPEGAGVIALADDYPAGGIHLDGDLLDRAAAKRLRLYVEYPSSLPGVALDPPRPTHLERLVVASDFFAPALPRHSILAEHGCWLRRCQVESAHLVAARVAGYRRAVYGLPDEIFPVLFDLPGREVMVATSKLSGFVTGRYGPAADWHALWQRLLAWLSRSDSLPALSWQPSVAVALGPEDALPETAEAEALARSVRWFRDHVVYSEDSKKGALEGFESPIDHWGRQMRRASRRADCSAESALVFACDWALRGDPTSRTLSAEILDTVWSSPDFVQTDPSSPAYGLVNWYDRAPVFYGDDNARVVLATLAAARLLDEERWDVPVLRCLLANLRTSGSLGFRRNRIDLAGLAPGPRGWATLRAEPVVSYSPHFQAYLWAAWLWAYSLTGYAGFLEPTVDAIGMTMAAYPGWQWTNGLTQEIARMLLPLAQLVRIQDTPEHRGWLDRIATDLLAQMQPSGAIREALGALKDGRYPSPRDNASYGQGEASIVHENGDPACDLLYTTSYAFLGLREAWRAAGDTRLARAEDRLADFLCRIQVRSTTQPYLDGAWMRSFDYELWEYWGSSADQGWGAWSVESGWTNSWIAAALALRRLGQTLLGEGVGARRSARIRAMFPDLIAEML